MIASQIETIAKAENFELKTDIIQMVADCADGSMRDAQSLLDQILSFVGTDASLETVAEVLGTVERPLIVELSEQLALKNTKDAISTAQRLNTRGVDLRRFLESLCLEFRHLCLASITGTLNGYGDLSDDDRNSIEKRAGNLPYLEWERLFSMTLKGVDALAQSQHPQLHLELLFLQICTRPEISEATEIQKAIQMFSGLSQPESASGPGRGGNASSVIPSVSRSAHSAHSAGSGRTTEPPRPKSTPVRIAPLPPRKKLQLKDVDQEWLAFVEDLGNLDPVLGSHFEHAKLMDKSQIGDGYNLTINFERRVHFEAIELEKSNPELRAILDSHFGAGSRFESKLASAPEQKKAHVPKVPQENATINQARKETKRVEENELRQAALADPVVKQALEIFGGEIRNIERI